MVSKENGRFRLNEENLKKILHREDVQDKPVVVLSIAGPLRKGKSFLLNFCIRYLDYAIENKVSVQQKHNTSLNWIPTFTFPYIFLKLGYGKKKGSLLINTKADNLKWIKANLFYSENI